MKITQQPEATPGVEGQQLVLECRATGVPVPNFLWFKAPNTPIPDQTADTLLIPRLSKKDGGKYCCRAENEVNIVFSAWVEVKVQKPHILKNGWLEVDTFSVGSAVLTDRKRGLPPSPSFLPLFDANNDIRVSFISKKEVFFLLLYRGLPQ